MIIVTGIIHTVSNHEFMTSEFQITVHVICCLASSLRCKRWRVKMCYFGAVFSAYSGKDWRERCYLLFWRDAI